MAARFSRFKFATAATLGFVVGVFFASGADLTRFSWAQTTAPLSNAVRGPGAAEGLGSFAEIAERVTPAVVAVNTTRNARPNARMRNRSPQGMEDFLNRLNIPSKRDIEDLSAKIAQLAARVEELRKQP